MIPNEAMDLIAAHHSAVSQFAIACISREPIPRQRQKAVDHYAAMLFRALVGRQPTDWELDLCERALRPAMSTIVTPPQE